MRGPVPQRRSFTESRGVGATLSPLSLATALWGLAHQTSLVVPAKFILSADGRAGIQAEVPRVLEFAECRKLAREALDAALAWVEASGTSGAQPSELASPGVDTTDEVSEKIESALEQLPGSWRQLEGGRYQLYASPAPGFAVRVNLSWWDRAGLRASSDTRLRAAAPLSRRAMAHFALEVNPRLRLARVAVEDAEDAGVRIVWDALLPSTAPLEQGIPPVAEAVVHAQVLTRRAFAALKDERVASAYLRLRGADAAEQSDAGRSQAARRWTGSNSESIPIAHESVRQPVGPEA